MIYVTMIQIILMILMMLMIMMIMDMKNVYQDKFQIHYVNVEQKLICIIEFVIKINNYPYVHGMHL